MEIEGGLVLLDASHDGSSNFIVSLVPESGTKTIMTNAIGSYDGTTAALVDSGTYILDVDADGSWSIELTQPRPESGESLPISLSGSGNAVHGPVAFDGTGIANATHEASGGNFSVEIFPTTGLFQTLVFNEIGSFEGETTYSFDSVGFVAVTADGKWSLDME